MCFRDYGWLYGIVGAVVVLCWSAQSLASESPQEISEEQQSSPDSAGSGQLKTTLSELQKAFIEQRETLAAQGRILTKQAALIASQERILEEQRYELRSLREHVLSRDLSRDPLQKQRGTGSPPRP